MKLERTPNAVSNYLLGRTVVGEGSVLIHKFSSEKS